MTSPSERPVPSRVPVPPGERPRVVERLRTALLTQRQHLERHTGSLEELRRLDTLIQKTAWQLRPDEPGTVIRAAQQELAYDDLAQALFDRSALPVDPDLTLEPTRIRTQFLESKILDLARELEPADPRRAISLATPIAHRQLPIQYPGFGATFLLEEAHHQVADASRRLGRLAAFPEPSPQQRVHQTLMSLRRLDRLGLEHRHDSQVRSQLAFRGNVADLKATLAGMPEPRNLLETSAARVYRNPDPAIRSMRENTGREGLQATIERFGENPAAFGKLRGFHVPGFGDSPRRTSALGLAQQSAGRTSTAHTQRDRIERHLDSAVTYQRRQNENRQLASAYPSRDQLLTELGRHMEGLEIHQVRPLLQPGQAKIVQDVRRAEQTFLEPLRKGARNLLAFEAKGVALSQPAVQAKAQAVAVLFQHAPKHILKRLTPPQMQGALLAAAVARRVVKTATRAARV